ncbi:SMP-30/gluconolactonase/LRE family protein [Maribacter sp. CXY002]|uniref:SMP-30/gluconolactonase/LRE family protein n=1 Tax=Maribacter luteocoastalis TaxID=3407671 RepID=UPI003B674837
MKKGVSLILFGLILLISCKENSKGKTEPQSTEKSVKTMESQELDSISKNFYVEILDDEGLRFLKKDASIKMVAEGFQWTEGPLWIQDGEFLLFSDVMANTIYKLDSNNNLTTFLKPSGFTGEGTYSPEPGSNGLILDKKGGLILMQHGDRRVAKLKTSIKNPKPEFITLADNFKGQKLNSPNDGFLDKEGNLYFTDPPYGLPQQMNDPTKELDFQGVFCLLKSGELKLLDTLSRPNGITQSPDGKILYVAISDPKHAVWYKYDIESPGVISNKKLFYDVTDLIDLENPHGLPDGMKTNSKGYVFASGPDGIWIFNPTAKLIARIHTGQSTSNCAFNSDETKVYITADDYLLVVDLK